MFSVKSRRKLNHANAESAAQAMHGAQTHAATPPIHQAIPLIGIVASMNIFIPQFIDEQSLVSCQGIRPLQNELDFFFDL